MDYHPTKAALFKPHLMPALPPVGVWSLDARCAEFSRLAYFRFEAGQRQQLEDAVSSHGFTGFESFEDVATASQGFAAVTSDGVAIIAIRGTEKVAPASMLARLVQGLPFDLWTDAKIGMAGWAGSGKVHIGFRNAFDALIPKIKDWLQVHPHQRIVVTGHSLGAAIATLVAGVLPDAELVTFGSPRVGNADFAASLNAREVRRYVDCCDVVTKVPPPLIGYEHIAGGRYVDRAGTVLKAYPEAAWISDDQAKAIRDYWKKYAWRMGNNWFRSLSDHAPINYVSALRGLRS